MNTVETNEKSIIQDEEIEDDFPEQENCEEIKKIEEIILISTNSDLIKFIDKNYDYMSLPTTEVLYEKVENLSKLEKKTLELGITRIDSMLDLYDPTKSISVIGTILVALLGVFGLYINSWISTINWLSSNSYILILLVYLGFFCFISINVGKIRTSKWRLQYFRGLLQYAIKLHEKERVKI